MRRNLMNRLLDELVKRLKTIEEKYTYLSFLIEERFTNEKLLQLEVMRIVSLMPEVVEYLPEKLYDYTSKEKCDFWFKTSDSTEHWMEIKLRPTNYRVMQSRAEHAKAITDGVKGVVEDIRRLGKDAKEWQKTCFIRVPANVQRTKGYSCHNHWLRKEVL